MAAGFRYWALGHIHKRSVAGRDEHGRDARHAAGPRHQRGRRRSRSAWSTVADDRSIRVEERVTSVAQFERVAVDLERHRGLARRDRPDRSAGWRGRAGKAASDHLVARLQARRARRRSPGGCGAMPTCWPRTRPSCRRRGPDLDREAGARLCGARRGGRGAPSADPVAELARLIGTRVMPSELFRAGNRGDRRRADAASCRANAATCSARTRRDACRAARRSAREGVEDVLARLRTGTGAG